jgi:hypothetical protein
MLYRANTPNRKPIDPSSASQLSARGVVVLKRKIDGLKNLCEMGPSERHRRDVHPVERAVRFHKKESWLGKQRGFLMPMLVLPRPIDTYRPHRRASSIGRP